MVPNVRVLNLNYNFLEDPRPLDGLTRLRKLTIIGSRIKGAKQLIRMLRGMRDIEMVDFRYVSLPSRHIRFRHRTPSMHMHSVGVQAPDEWAAVSDGNHIRPFT